MGRPMVAMSVAAALLLSAQSPALAQNVAQGKSTAQSSEWGSPGESWRAVDGNTNGNWNYGSTNSVSHTQFQANAWWYVDLGSTFAVSQIKVWNRTDCCESRLYPVRIAVQDVFNAAVSSVNDVWSQDFSGDPDSDHSTPLLLAPAGAQGRFVKVQLLRSEYLHLAEVEVFGATPNSSVTPEPVSMALLGTGLAGVAGVRRRRRRDGTPT